MDLRGFFDRLAEAENTRFKREVHDRDIQAQLDWDKLLVLASNAPSAIVSIARARAPEAMSRVEDKTPAGAAR